MTALIAAAAVLVGLAASGVAGWTTWLWLATRRHAQEAEQRLLDEIRDKDAVMADLLAYNARLATHNDQLTAYVERCIAWLTTDLRWMPTRHGGDL